MPDDPPVCPKCHCPAHYVCDLCRCVITEGRTHLVVESGPVREAGYLTIDLCRLCGEKMTGARAGRA